MSAHPQVLLLVAAALLQGGALPARAQQEEAKPAVKEKTAKPRLSPEAMQTLKEGAEAMKRRDWRKAAEAWEKAVKLDPANAGAWANLGKVQLQQNETAPAIASLEKAVALQPNLADAWMTLGLAYEGTQASMRAISCLTRAAHESPADPRVHNSLAIVLKRAGWTDAAESELQKALDLDADYAEAHFNLAVMYLEKRPPSLELARRHYEAARKLGAEPDKEMEAQLAGKDPAVEDTSPPPAQKLPAPEKPQSKTTRPK